MLKKTTISPARMRMSPATNRMKRYINNDDMSYFGDPGSEKVGNNHGFLNI
jgi:hypothetical protein